MTPGYGEAGGYYEDGVLACLRFVPLSYPFKVDSFTAAYSNAPPCSLVPDMLWAIGTPDQTTGFVWSTPVPAQMGGVGTLAVGQTLNAGQALFACLKLASLSTSERSCPTGCYFPSTGQNGDYFWGDTAPPDGTMAGGLVLNPPVLEPLSVSPTATIAANIGNDKIGLVIDVFEAP